MPCYPRDVGPGILDARLPDRPRVGGSHLNVGHELLAQPVGPLAVQRGEDAGVADGSCRRMAPAPVGQAIREPRK
jgi:hypothetical protein